MNENKNKYIIRRKDNDLDAQWAIFENKSDPNSEMDQRTILFDTMEEVNIFIEQNYYFFEGVDYEIVPVPESERTGIRLSYVDYFNFKDIKDTEEYKESICYKA